MTKLTSAIIGALVGGVLFQWTGVVAGLLMGLFAASVAELRQRVMKLEARLDEQVVGASKRPAAAEPAPAPRESSKSVQAATVPPAAPRVNPISAGDNIPKPRPSA